MNYQTNQRLESEFDLENCFWRLLSQWKAVLLISLVMAFLVSGAKHMKAMKSYNMMKDAKTETSEASERSEKSFDERIEDVMESLSDDDKGSVAYVIEQKELSNDYKEYISNSILFNTDPSNQRTLCMTYDIEVKNPGDLPVLMRSFQTYVNGDRFAGAIKESIDPNADNVYISELMQFETYTPADLDNTNGAAALKFNIVLPEQADAEAVAAAATATLKEYRSELQANYPGSISIAGCQESHLFDRINADIKANTLYVINNINNNIKTAESSLSEKQRQAVNTIMSIKSEASTFKKEITATNEKDPAAEEEPAVPGWSKKYALLGFVLGAFLYTGIYVLFSLLRGRVGSASTAESTVGARTLGEVYFENKKTGITELLLHSNLVNKWRYRGKLDDEKQINRVTSSLEAICSHANLNILTVLNMIVDRQTAEKLMKKISVACKERGVSLNILDIKEEIDEKDISLAKNVVFALDDNVKTSEIGRMVRLCKTYDVSIMGSVYTEEV